MEKTLELSKLNAKELISGLLKWHPKQELAFHAAFLYRYILYGGARGGGKSFWLRWMMVYICVFFATVLKIKNVHVMLACESYPALADRQISKISMEFPPWLGELKKTAEDGLGFYIKEEYGGGVICLRNLDDPDKYLSAEFAAIGIDQAERIDYKTFNMVRSCNRWPGVDRPMMLITANPGGGIGQRWIKDNYVDGNLYPEIYGSNLAGELKYIEALPSDNPSNSKTYIDDLMSQIEPLRRAWIDADWTVYLGAAFGPFKVIKPIDLPPRLLRQTGYDVGYNKPFANLWSAMNPDTGRYYIYREAYAAGLTDRQQGNMIRELEDRQEVELIRWRFADPSIWAKKNVNGVVTSTYDELKACGIYMKPGDNDRHSGKRKVDRAMSRLPDGYPGVIVFDTCSNLIKTMSTLILDEHDTEDVDTRGEDHLYDAFKYMLTRMKDPVRQVVRDEQYLIKAKYKNPWNARKHL